MKPTDADRETAMPLFEAAAGVGLVRPTTARQAAAGVAVDAIAQALAAERAKAAGRERWIPVGERTPEPGREVHLVYVSYLDNRKRRFVCQGTYDAEKEQWLDPSNCDAAGDENPYLLSEVTHWRELPPLPADASEKGTE
jgi:hypothetical protein